MNKTITEKLQHPLLTIALFIVYFLAIHPFQDGNGRLSRILTTLLLLQVGYSYVPYCSLESIIEENKNAYYKALRTAQKTLATDDSGIDRWLSFFIHCLKKQTTILEERVASEKTHALSSLPPLSITILNMAKQQSRITISDILAVESVHRNTIKSHIKALVNNRYLDSHGTGKGTFYTRSR
tara:strand:- start:140 stop:685 length:546 start_codon:yes stop_codon:yes gene_type:complete